MATKKLALGEYLYIGKNMPKTTSVWEKYNNNPSYFGTQNGQKANRFIVTCFKPSGMIAGATSFDLFLQCTSFDNFGAVLINALNTTLDVARNLPDFVYPEYTKIGWLTRDTTNLTLSYTNLPYNENGYVLGYDGAGSTSMSSINQLFVDVSSSYITMTYDEAAISSISVSGNSVDSAITLSWSQEHVDSWIVQVIQNNTVTATKSGTTATTCTFNVGEIKRGGSTTFKIIATNAIESVEYTKVVTLTEPTASVSNFTVSGSRIDEAITCSWKMSNAYNWIVQAMQGGSVLASKSGTTETTCTFNAGEITKGGDVTFRITVGNTWNSTYHDTVKSLTIPTATIKDFNVKGTSIDSNITCTWSQTDVYNWTVQAIQNGIVKASKTGTSNTGCTFNVGDLVNGGETVFRIIASNTWNSTQVDEVVTLSYTQAKIDLLDLPSTNVNTDNNFLISWVTQNQTSYRLEIDGKIYTGTTEKSLLIPRNTVGKGSKTIKLTIWFTNEYYQNTDTKEIIFTSYGKPDAPTLNIGSSINVATPTISWVCDEQMAFRLIIKQGEKVFLDTLDTVSIVKSYKLTKALSNNTDYTFILKIKSQYGLWSDETNVVVKAEFDVPNKPTISATNGENGSILLHVKTTVTGDVQYKYTEIWKKEPTSDWKRMAVNMSYDDAWVDFYCGGDIIYQYKAVNVGKTGARVESEVVKGSTKVKDYNLYNVENTNESFTFSNDVVIKPTLVRNVVSNKFSGCRAPKSERDSTCYYRCNIEFSNRTENDEELLINLINNSKLLLLKDKKGHKWIGTIVSDITPEEDDIGIKYFSFEFVEEAFLEQDVYNGGFNGIIKYPLVWDGTWMFDGSEVFGE